MKRIAALVAVLGVSLCMMAQEKPRVFVQGKGSEDKTTNGGAVGGRHWAGWSNRSTTDSHDEGMEITSDLKKNCSGVIVTLNQQNADYTVLLNRESKQNRGLLRTNSQVEVANRDGDIINTKATRTVNNAAKDVCAVITADWSSHGSKANATASADHAAHVVNAAEKEDAPEATSATMTDKEKQHQACLALAKDNPSIVCK